MSDILIVINILAIIISPLIASLISIHLTRSNDKKQEKIKILEKLMLTRLNSSTMDYVNALNLIDIVFYDSKNVRNEYKKLLKEYYTDKPDSSKIYTRKLKLIESILKDIGYCKIDWEDISMPYAPIWYYDELQKQEKYKEAQLSFADIIKNINTPSQKDNKNEPNTVTVKNETSHD